MTIGEHLEELRKRLIYGLLGFAVALIGCMAYGERVVTIFCAPLFHGLQKHDIDSRLVTNALTEGFMTYLQISIVCGIVIAGPWMIYQLWLFIAAGLYPNERKTITRYIPLSITLMLTGVLFVYFLVLPLTIDFFLTFTSGMPMPGGQGPTLQRDVPAIFTMMPGDPANPPDGAIWFNTEQNRLKIRVHHLTRVLTFGPENLLNTQISLDDYISLVLTFMLVFAVAFQLPLVLLALVRIGIVDIEFLRKQRKIVYFVMAIVAAVIAPGDVVTSMLALLIPLLLLYEFGIWLAQLGEKQRRKEREEASTSHD
jgi:sec-independent protein translocase protein TatC